MKKIIKGILLLIVFIVLVVASSIGLSQSSIVLTKGNLFDDRETVNMEVSEYNKNGSDWGHNQNKMASIGDIIFSFNFDNSNFINGNSSVDNPYYCDFIMIIDDDITEFDSKTCNRPGNVLTDAINNKVYYILSTPTGEANNGGEDYSGVAQTIMFEYDFDSNNKVLTLFDTHYITPDGSDGKIRQGVDMDDNGNIIIAYGRYDSMMNVYTYDRLNRVWKEYVTSTNNDGDSLMYSIPSMKDLNNFYILSEQDTCNDDGCFYQYVKFFAYEDEVWSEKMIVDYRESDKKDEPKLVLNSECYYYDGVVHIFATSSKMREVTYYTYEDGTYTRKDTAFLSHGVENLKIVEKDSKLYLTSLNATLRILFPKITVYDLETLSVVYTFRFIPLNRYYYVNTSDSDFQLLIYTSKKGILYNFAFSD